jgi:hypothetical protein
MITALGYYIVKKFQESDQNPILAYKPYGLRQQDWEIKIVTT